ncbi:uncharacterized protein CcaverHIS019_0102630 [Cutaneotrichosporon cavernicola]|uniref:LEM-like domain-containing protein n=1 Tax=Cutaneotrichosporon cavernicola TaxID=279322 RepID=A0AA48KZZ6_9TREE|nr:uncharacterized protein CcaverHIS019_0102630 [Cutaneotrichosporon cavernicola]BEI87545.1 hypothetical protein CcaverHIS019_0102630 [Cutaneotrichosporon cavernicola]BEI95317.1 hypothetical protein CcaverHIS631_0102660 [Cutaneotrichosporon cavernicola]BEJ03090.1 hypothetical protein CcaverHIS641_0102650 [Cutaneotrichosporon cavernicola]
MSVPSRDVYLAQGFDPASLRVPQLRSILHEYNVRHPSTAKKADLIALFVSEIQPRSAAILAQQARVRPSSTGIVAVSSTGEEAPAAPIIGKRPRARSRKAASSAAEDPKSEDDVVAVPAKRTRSRRSTVDVADEEAAPTPAPKKRGRPSKKSKEVAEVDEDGDVKMEDIPEASSPLPPPPLKQRRKSAKAEALVHSNQEPVEAPRTVPATAPAAVRKPRKSFVPAPKPEEHMTPQRPRRSSNVADGSSPFSDYNPFQAGSAEAAEVAHRRRKSSLGLGEGKRRAPRPSEWTATSQPSASILRKVGPSNENLRSPAPPTKVAYADEVAEADAYNAVVERKFGEVTSAHTDEPEITVTTTTQVVERPVQRSKGKAIMRRKPRPNSKVLPLSLFGILLFLLTAHYKSMSASNGFCDDNSRTNSVILSRELPIKAAQDCISQRSQDSSEFATTDCNLQALPLVPFFPRPQECTPCPVNAQCNRGEVISCDPEYILRPSLLAPLSPLFDGWPMLPSRVFPPKCKPDTARMRQIGQLATQVERFLAQRRGTFECTNTAVDLTVGPGVRYGVSEKELLNMFAERRVDSIDRDDFNEMFQRAVTDLVSHKELVESIDEYGTSYYTSARSEMSIPCRVKLHLLGLLDEWKSEVGGTVAVIAVIFALRNRVQASRTESKQVREYTEMAVRRLQDQEYRHYTDPVLSPTSYMPPAQLRDVILPASLGQGAKQRVWSKVEAKVEENANVLVREREVKGDVWKTWEWNAIGGGRAVQVPSSPPAIEPRPPAF